MKNTRQLLCSAMLLMATALQGQTFEWVKESYTGGYMAIIWDHAGHIAAAKTDNTIACFDNKGDTLWTKHYLGEVYPVSLSQDSHDNYYLTGMFRSGILFDDKPIGASGQQDMFIAKLDHATKTFSWVKRMGGQDHCTGMTLASDDNGNTYLGASFFGDCDFEGTHLQSVGGQNSFVAKLNEDGDILWLKSFGAPTDAEILSLKLNGKDIIAVGRCGTHVKFDSTEVSGKGSTNGFVCCLDTSGSIHWAKVFDSCSVEQLVADANKNVYITGYFVGDVNFGLGTLHVSTNSRTDIFLAKLDSLGSADWVTRSTGNYLNYSQALAIDDQDNCYLAGTFSNNIQFGDLYAKGHGDYDGFIVRFSPEGKPLWMKTFGGTGQDYANELLLSPDKKRIILAGYIQKDSVSLDGLTLNGSSNPRGLFFLSGIYGGTSGIAPVVHNTSTFKMYPNPSSGSVTLQWEQADIEACRLQITDISGRTVLQMQLRPESNSLQVNGLTPGIYLIRTDKNQFGKLIVQ